jgi:hypothetical protein
MDRVRKAGIITDLEERHVAKSALQVIDDLLFKLKQTEDEKERLSTKVYDLYKQQRVHAREEDPHGDENM